MDHLDMDLAARPFDENTWIMKTGKKSCRVWNYDTIFGIISTFLMPLGAAGSTTRCELCPVCNLILLTFTNTFSTTVEHSKNIMTTRKKKKRKGNLMLHGVNLLNSLWSNWFLTLTIWDVNFHSLPQQLFEGTKWKPTLFRWEKFRDFKCRGLYYTPGETPKSFSLEEPLYPDLMLC